MRNPFKKLTKPETKYAYRLPKDGRSSKEQPATFGQSIASLDQFYTEVYPIISWELQNFISKLAIVNPDISQAVKNYVNLANTGHRIIVDAANAEAILDRLNALAGNIYQRSAGIDGLVNHLIAQIAISGAISFESVIDIRMKSVEKVVIIPVSQIRYKYEDGDYRPYQTVNAVNFKDSLIPLNTETYTNYIYQAIENSPYPKPPFISAVEPILRQKSMLENLDYIMQKFGFLGLVAMSLTPPTIKAGEAEPEYQARCLQYATDVQEALVANYSKGVMTKFSDQELQHFNVTGEARGANDIFQLNEEQIFSGIGTDPAMHGRTYSTTETYAGVVYNLLVRDSENIRRIVKRGIERIYKLDLLLGGIKNIDVSLQFNRAKAKDPENEARARQVEDDIIFKRIERGIISPDQGAQEMGYDSAYDPSLAIPSIGLNLQGASFAVPSDRTLEGSKKVFSFSPHSQKYIYLPERIILKKNLKQTHAILSDRQPTELDFLLEEQRLGFVAKYQEEFYQYILQYTDGSLTDLVEFLKNSKYEDFKDQRDFATQVFEKVILPNHAASVSIVNEKDVFAVLNTIYQHYRLSDSTLPVMRYVWGEVDTRTLDFLSKADYWYFSKYIDNETYRKPIENWLADNFFKNGRQILDLEPDIIESFKTQFAEILSHSTDYNVRGIVNTSVSRSRNWANFRSLNEAGFKFAEIMAVMDTRTSMICRELDGKKIPIQKTVAKIDELIKLAPEEFEQTFKNQPAEWRKDPVPYIQSHIKDNTVDDEMIDKGVGFPPYHINCRTRVIYQS